MSKAGFLCEHRVPIRTLLVRPQGALGLSWPTLFVRFSIQTSSLSAIRSSLLARISIQHSWPRYLLNTNSPSMTCRKGCRPPSRKPFLLDLFCYLQLLLEHRGFRVCCFCCFSPVTCIATWSIDIVNAIKCCCCFFPVTCIATLSIDTVKAIKCCCCYSPVTCIAALSIDTLRQSNVVALSTAVYSCITCLSLALYSPYLQHSKCCSVQLHVWMQSCCI